MKKILKYAAAFLLPVFFAQAVPAAAEEYTIDTYLTAVERNNKDLQIARKNTASAKQGMHQALSALLPSAGVSAGYNRNLKDIKQSTAVYAYDAGLNGVYPLHYENVDSNYDNEITAAVGVNMNIFDPAAEGSYQQAKKNYQIEGASEEFTRQNLITNAKELYAQVLLLNGVVTVKKETAETSEAVYRNQEKKYNAGTITELDLRMAEVDWKNDLTAAAEAAKNAAIGMMSLKTLAGIPQAAEMVLIDDNEALPALPEKTDVEKVLADRGDYRIALLAKDIADLSWRNSLTAYLPTVTGSFSVAYGQYGGYEGKDDWDAYDYTAATIGMKITLPLFTGGYRTSTMLDAKIKQQKAALQIEQKRDQIEQDLMSAQLRMEEAQQRIESAKTLQQTAERAATLARVALDNGMGTQLSVSQSDTQLALAKLGLQNAIYDYRAAYYDWEFACGKTE